MGSQKDREEYWYFRMKESMVFDAELQQIKSFPVLGYITFVIYVELCARATKNGGYLKIYKTPSESGYAASVAQIINESVDNTGNALSLLISRGLVSVSEEVDSVMLCVPSVRNNIGRSTLGADRIRGYMEQDKLNANKELLVESNVSKSFYGIFQNIELSENEFICVQRYTTKPDEVIDMISISKHDTEETGNYQDLMRYAIKNNYLSDIGQDELLPK